MNALHIIDEGTGNFSVTGNLSSLNITHETLKSLTLLSAAKIITVDLSRIETIDSAGLALMIEWIKYARSQRLALNFKHIPQQMHNLAKLSGLDDLNYFVEPSN
ncbi:MAG: STAS domain-containing protein [Methylovulum sp.]|jgi:phospholipid transport system transporter-binding protein